MATWRAHCSTLTRRFCVSGGYCSDVADRQLVGTAVVAAEGLAVLAASVHNTRTSIPD